ncbi:succinate dehydrogenase cytochrome b558 subunit [Chlamydia caviae]|uniref:Succinate dehydrogenase, cytochrome b558 subunit, putative n=1 Tax=Chlamydia caviae (strain ATCC VR-813 / DSM 19441 / 03DC25 / GPIC) TaxID=227941 RepID=Q821H1_CHLCV|nr:succinate dehydrogenase cytochrome b558 subunit [Chlamydia caviae]AAP05708.1 succinate dehydrogenase, cytochrome b558 subunit, putative [Chlamydia caviae GPIC]
MKERGTCSGTAQKPWKYYTSFVLRCVHSLAGVAFTLFLCEHMFINMLASSYFNEGKGFVQLVSKFHQIPGLKIIEITFLALPFICHAIIGIVYLFQGKSNSGASDGSKPALVYARNIAYTWQRRTAWILLFGLIFHVVQFRFLRYPLHVELHGQTYYVVDINSSRYPAIVRGTKGFFTINFSAPQGGTIRLDREDLEGSAVSKLSENKAYVLTPNVGAAFLYIVRDSLGSLWIAIFYTLLVIAAAFHGFNGLWTFCSRWGVVISFRSQALLRSLCYFAMVIVSTMGISVIWNLYSVA